MKLQLCFTAGQRESHANYQKLLNTRVSTCVLGRLFYDESTISVDYWDR